eukprot:342029-Pyramimonas_sp.AAC.1
MWSTLCRLPPLAVRVSAHGPSPCPGGPMTPVQVLSLFYECPRIGLAVRVETRDGVGIDFFFKFAPKGYSSILARI